LKEHRDYYVYEARDGEKVVYIGCGRLDRINHVNSGHSHNVNINRHFFTKGPLVVEKVAVGLTRDQARRRESLAIGLCNPAYNVVKVNPARIKPKSEEKSFQWIDKPACVTA